MKIMMNKNIAVNKYAAMLSLREIITVALCILAATIGYLLLNGLFGWSMETSSYFFMPVILVIGIGGFYKKDGMTAIEIAKKKLFPDWKIYHRSISHQEYDQLKDFLMKIDKQERIHQKERIQKQKHQSQSKSRRTSKKRIFRKENGDGILESTE